MKTQRLRHRDIAALFALTAGALLAPGCGGDDNPEPTTPVITGGSSGSSGKGGRAGSGGSSPEGGGGSSPEGGGANEAGSGEGGDDTGPTAGRSSGGRAGSAGRGNTSGNGGSGNTGNEGGGGGEEPQIDCSVRGPDNCYRCDPVAIDPAPAFPHSENEQFLNHCDDSQGSAFDNFDRIPGFTGTLPTL